MLVKTRDADTQLLSFTLQTLIMAAINLPQQPLVALTLQDLSLATRATVMQVEKQLFLSFTFRNMAQPMSSPEVAWNPVTGQISKSGQEAQTQKYLEGCLMKKMILLSRTQTRNKSLQSFIPGGVRRSLVQLPL